MVEVEVYGERARCQNGVWTAESQALTDLLNAPWNQPDAFRYRLDPDIDAAEHVVKTMGAQVISTEPPPTEPGVVY